MIQETSYHFLFPVPLIGKSLLLEPLKKTHYDLLQPIANDPRIWDYMPTRADGEFFDSWFQDCLEKQKKFLQLTYVVRKKSDNQIIGCFAYYDIDLQHQKLEVGYAWLTPKVWGTHYNHESLFMLFQNAFETWHINRVQVAADPRNKRSHNLLKKLGATQEGLLRQHMIHHNGRITDTVLFSILAKEWATVKEQLEKRLSHIDKSNH